MLKIEKRSRSVSVTYRQDRSGNGQCSRARMRPLTSAEAEHLLKNVSGASAAYDEEHDPEFLEFLHPKLPRPDSVDEQGKADSLQQLTSKFFLTDQHLLHIEARMMDEVNRGLGKDTNAKANVKSFITYVHELPTGRESGEYLALDLGGTNFRVIHVKLEAGSTSIGMQSHKHEVSKALMEGPGSDLFDFMAECLHTFLKDHNLLGHRYHLGFTFSFPTRQHSLARADLATWTKGFCCAGVEGEDVVGLLQTAIAKIPALDVQVDALLNDTTGCLIACAYKRPECAIGVILGTGTNASYVEDMHFVDLYEGERPPGSQAVVINTEWGAFGNTGSLDIIRTSFDHELDAKSLNPGKQVYEKLISGMYLGELTRLILLEAVDRGILFDGKNQSVLAAKGAFPTKYLSEIEADPSRDEFLGTSTVLNELGIVDATRFDMQVIRYICECVSSRAAALAGAGLASLINRVGRRRITVGMDGSLYKFHPYLGFRMRYTVRRLINESVQFEMVLSEDGSGRGAALAAAVAAKQEQKLRNSKSTQEVKDETHTQHINLLY